MEEHTVRLKAIEKSTHDVLRIVTEKPKDYSFRPGQATEVCIDRDSCRSEKGPFTFTSLPKDNDLEFTIKTYPTHEGITKDLLSLKPNDELILHDIFGAIAYKGEGVFIAGGAGITPFIAILRDLLAKGETGNNKLIFANKTKADIIIEDEFQKMLGKNFVNILSDEEVKGYHHGQITEAFLKENIGDTDQYFYVCGPPSMIEAVVQQLNSLGVEEDKIIKEKM